jgi:hypothetical protein
MIRLFEEPLKPISRPALVAWLIFYSLFLIYAARESSGFLLIDNVNLVIHEAGHPLFSYLGEWMGVLGGTLLQWAVPLMLAASFFYRRETTGFVFCLFFFFENWLYTATYMADARAQDLPLVSIGGGDDAIHDWNYLFTSMGCLASDTRIASIVRACGWIGMLATVVWFLLFALSQPAKRED